MLEIKVEGVEVTATYKGNLVEIMTALTVGVDSVIKQLSNNSGVPEDELIALLMATVTFAKYGRED